ncbi:hypothetical protein BYT27DRAFT_6350490 [Phlegmacium glaucopus]|nr:hypothetical protein BYT27DRAFT_6350490 [Phlegmacium glaucopus]
MIETWNRMTDFSSQGETSKPRVFTPSPDISEDGPSRSGIPPGNDELLQEHGIDSTPNHTAQTDVTTPTRNKASRSLRNEFKTPSPPKGLPELPTPSSSDESDHGSPRSNATSRMSRHSPSSLKWMATPKPPGGWLDTPKPSREATGQGGLLTPVASLSKGSDLEPKTPAIPGAWLATPAVKKSILKVRFEPQVSTLTDKFLEPAKHSDPSFDVSTSESAANGLDVGEDDLQRTEQLSLKLPPVRRQKSLKSPKIRVLDAFGREQESDVSKQECVNSSPSLLRVVDDMGHEMDEGSLGEGTEAVATPSYSAPSRGELLLRIRNGLDDLVVGLDDFDEDNQASSIDHDRVQQLTTISRQARGLRESLYSQADSSRSLLSSTLTTKTSWLPVNRRAYIFLIILQVSFVWLMYRCAIFIFVHFSVLSKSCFQYIHDSGSSTFAKCILRPI